MFFKAMPKITYKVDEKTIVTKDIFRRVGLDRQINNRLALESHYVKNGETPDIISNNVYGSSKYHWTILVVNDIVDTYEEWPKRDEELLDFVESKYGTGNANFTHHYRLIANKDITVDYDPSKISEIEPVTNYNYELDINQSKRQIFLLKTEYISRFIANYKKLMVV